MNIKPSIRIFNSDTQFQIFFSYSAMKKIKGARITTVFPPVPDNGGPVLSYAWAATLSRHQSEGTPPRRTQNKIKMPGRLLLGVRRVRREGWRGCRPRGGGFTLSVLVLRGRKLLQENQTKNIYKSGRGASRCHFRNTRARVRGRILVCGWGRRSCPLQRATARRPRSTLPQALARR